MKQYESLEAKRPLAWPKEKKMDKIGEKLDNIMSNVEGPIAQRKESLRDIIDNIENTIRKIEHGLNKTKEDLVGKLSLFCL